MKLAGLTWWRNNYGSILQAYALQQALSQFDNIEYEILCQYGKRIASADNFFDKVRKIGFIKSCKRVFWKFGVPGLRKRNYNIQQFVDKKLRVSAKQYDEKSIVEANAVYDAFICGSDQIWNPELPSATRMYRLGFADDFKRKIAYAPSIGVDSMSEVLCSEYRCDLSRFDALSCREESGTQLINSILGKEKCVTVLDPTLMVDKRIWDELCSSRKFNEPYIFVYMLRGTKTQRKIIEQYARNKKLQVVTMPFLETDYTEWYDFKFGDIKFWDAAPDEFISVIRYAECVFTDSFHSTVFSCLYHTPFFVFPKIGKAQLGRVMGLQQLLEISSRIVTTEEEIEKIDQTNSIDWIKVDKILEQKRVESQHYLKKAVL